MAERRRRRPSQDSEEESDGSEDPKNITKDSECESEGPPAEEYESAEEAEVKEIVPKEKTIELTVVESEKQNDEKKEEEEEEAKSADDDVVLEDDYTEDGDEEESWQDGERQEGDGEISLQESDVTDLKERVLDDDEDRKNPQYIPKKGVFYEHDNRLDEPQEESERNQLLKKNKKLWKDDGKWIHDRYRSDEQAPKTREELIAIYGYDIRNEDGPPRAGRRRRYGRGPNKYTRKWDDENAYRLARGQGLHIRVTRGGRGRARSHSADSISDKPRYESTTSKDAESVSEHDHDSVSSKEVVRNSFRESISDSRFTKKEFIPEIKVLTPKEIEQFRRGAPPRDRRPFNRGRFDRGIPKPRFIPNNFVNNNNNNNNVKLEIEFDKLHIGNGDGPRVTPEIKTEPVLPEKNLEKIVHPADLGIKKETKSPPENLHMGDRRGVQPSVRHNVTSNRPKRYSSQRQRTMTDTPPYQSHIMEAPQYFDTGYQAPVFADPPSPNAPQAPPPAQQYPSYNMPYQDAYGLRPITNPPRFYSPVTISTTQTVLPTPYIAAGAGLINYGTPHYPQYPIQQYPSPPPQPQPQEVYRGGVMYFNTQNQHSNPVWTPPRRPKAAIPIVPPPDDNKNYREEKKEMMDSPPKAAQEQSTEVKVEG